MTEIKESRPTNELDTKIENNLLFWRTRIIKNLCTKSYVPKHQSQTHSKENLGQIFSKWNRLQNSKLTE